MSEVLTPNVDELVAIYQFIRDNPEQHNQEDYALRTACGTAYCVAGHAVVRAGHELQWLSYDDGQSASAVFIADGFYHPIFGVAREILGLNTDQAWQLFDTINTLADIRRIVTDITGIDPEDGATHA